MAFLALLQLSFFFYSFLTWMLVFPKILSSTLPHSIFYVLVKLSILIALSVIIRQIIVPPCAAVSCFQLCAGRIYLDFVLATQTLSSDFQTHYSFCMSHHSCINLLAILPVRTSWDSDQLWFLPHSTMSSLLPSPFSSTFYKAWLKCCILRNLTQPQHF